MLSRFASYDQLRHRPAFNDVDRPRCKSNMSTLHFQHPLYGFVRTRLINPNFPPQTVIGFVVSYRCHSAYARYLEGSQLWYVLSEIKSQICSRLTCASQGTAHPSFSLFGSTCVVSRCASRAPIITKRTQVLELTRMFLCRLPAKSTRAKGAKRACAGLVRRKNGCVREVKRRSHRLDISDQAQALIEKKTVISMFISLLINAFSTEDENCRPH